MLYVEIYTDGACSGDNRKGGNGKGPGGWAAVLVHPSGTKLGISGCEPITTSNRMELSAAVYGLRAVGSSRARVLITTDSSYLKNCFTRYLPGWRRTGWRTKDGNPVANRDLWEALIAAVENYEVSWKHVRGHQSNELNNLADEMAVEAKKAGRGVTVLL